MLQGLYIGFKFRVSGSACLGCIQGPGAASTQTSLNHEALGSCSGV